MINTGRVELRGRNPSLGSPASEGLKFSGNGEAGRLQRQDLMDRVRGQDPTTTDWAKNIK